MIKLRKNTEIRAPAVRVIGVEGEQLGLMAIEKALSYVDIDAGVDLVEVSPKEAPPVCKLMNYGKYLYKLKKLDQQQKKHVKKTAVKGIRIGMSTGDHDLEFKLKQAEKFLHEKHLVKVVILFKGREASHKDLGVQKMKAFAMALAKVADVDSFPKFAGFQMVMVLKPKGV